MAYNEITVPRWQNLVRRRFGIVGQGGNVPVLASEIQPVVMIEPSSPEHELLRGVRTALGSIQRPVGLNEFASVALENPNASNKLLVVERIFGGVEWGQGGWASSLAWVIQLYNSYVSLTGWDVGPQSCYVRDFRNAALQLATGVIWTDSRPAAPPGSTYSYGPLAVTPCWNGAIGERGVFDFPCSFVLPPHTSIFLTVGGAGAPAPGSYLTVGFVWYEQELEVAESSGRIP